MSLQRVLAACAALALVAVACDGDDGTPSTTSSTTSTTEAAADVDPQACTGVEVVEKGGTDEVREDPKGGPLVLADIRHAGADSGCVEQVVFDLEEVPEGSSLGYVVAYRDGPFVEISGRRVEVEGEAFLSVTLFNGTAVDLSGEEPRETAAPPDLGPFAEFVVDVELVSDFEGVSEWIIGLDRERAFLVTADATGLVVDISGV